MSVIIIDCNCSGAVKVLLLWFVVVQTPQKYSLLLQPVKVRLEKERNLLLYFLV